MAGSMIYDTKLNRTSILAHDQEYFDFLDPHVDRFSLQVMSQALSNTCRYGGHCSRFYSVAEHSVHVSRIVPPEFAVEGLLHDAHEAFVGDMPTPLKALCHDFRRIESFVDEEMRARWGLPLEVSDAVKRADIAMLECERVQLFRRWDDWGIHGGIDIPDIKLDCWLPQDAREQFLIRAEELGLI
jgi:hypothetical protein